MSNRHQEKQFGFALAAITAAIALWPLFNAEPPSLLWGSASLGLFLIAWQTPGWLAPLVKVWMRLGHLLMIINSKILLAIAFYLIITPVALLFKLVGRDALKLRPEKTKSSWHTQTKKWSPESFKNQF